MLRNQSIFPLLILLGACGSIASFPDEEQEVAPYSDAPANVSLTCDEPFQSDGFAALPNPAPTTDGTFLDFGPYEYFAPNETSVEQWTQQDASLGSNIQSLIVDGLEGGCYLTIRDQWVTVRPMSDQMNIFWTHNYRMFISDKMNDYVTKMLGNPDVAERFKSEAVVLEVDADDYQGQGADLTIILFDRQIGVADFLLFDGRSVPLGWE